MCGIAGILSLSDNPVPAQFLPGLMDALRHRGPDAEGTYITDRIALGHRRLSIIDLSTAANQPMADSSGRYRLVFNGELYNFRDVKQKLKGYPFSTNSDSEVLVAAYAAWGPACLAEFAGMFAFAVWDEQEKSLFIARDRMGVKPLYYFRNDNYLLFSSEVRALLQSGMVPRKLNEAAVADYLHYQSVSSPFSVIQDVYQLEAGCWLLIKGGETTKEKYWDITKVRSDVDTDDRAQVRAQVLCLLRKSVERRLISDVPLGAFLSGGIDSATIVGLMSEASTSPVNTFTIGFDEKQYDESEFAGIVARKFNTRHTLVKLQPSVFPDELPNALDAMDVPSGDGINTYVVSKAIRKSGLTVALSGVGGDELFAGYPFFKQYLKLKKVDSAWPALWPLRHTGASVLSLKKTTRNDRYRQLLRTTENSIAGFYPVFRQILSPGMIRRLTRLETGSSSTNLEKQLHDLASCIDDYPLLSQVSIAEYIGYTQNTLLKDTDQMSMAVALEVREPFFDHELVQFVLNIPDRHKYPEYPKQLLVESMNGLLPREIVHRPKQGFLFPWNVWMRGELRNFCDALIVRACQRPFIRGDALMDYWRRFLRNDGTIRWMELWLFIILEHWLETNNVD